MRAVAAAAGKQDARLRARRDVNTAAQSGKASLSRTQDTVFPRVAKKIVTGCVGGSDPSSASRCVPCAACGTGIAGDATNAPATSKRVDCDLCGKAYHGRCLRPTDFVGLEEDRDATEAPGPYSALCIACECGSYSAGVSINLARHRAHDKAETAARDLLNNGFAVVDLADTDAELDAIRNELSRVRGDIIAHHNGLTHAYEALLNCGRAVPTLETGYANFRQRGVGRFDIVAPAITQPLFGSLCGGGSVIRRAIDIALPRRTTARGDLGPQSAVVEYASGVIYARSGASGQNWHTDGPSASTVSDDVLPYAINVFIPLIDCSAINGTQFVVGSHRPNTATDEHRVIPEVRVGQALLFEYRVLHRGLANQGSQPRPCVYLTFARKWYAGDMNFDQRRYKGTLEPIENARRHGGTF